MMDVATNVIGGGRTVLIIGVRRPLEMLLTLMYRFALICVLYSVSRG